ncbi:MAG: hypothetical protein H7263_13895 [Candidatus Sericytochromatia bacterium]|nr:hypothetical protein [Candidatus Sericytochromatia bacterium]
MTNTSGDSFEQKVDTQQKYVNHIDVNEEEGTTANKKTGTGTTPAENNKVRQQFGSSGRVNDKKKSADWDEGQERVK